MQTRRTLIIAFYLVSLAAVLDALFGGPGAFGSIFDQTVGQFDPGSRAREIQSPPSFERSESLDSVPNPQWIAVESMHGNLRVTRAADDEAMAEYSVKVWGSNTEVAENFAERVRVAWHKEDGGARLRLEQPETLPAGIRHVRVDVQLELPRDVDATISHFGNVEATDIEGSLSLNHTAGEASLRGLRGPVAITSRFSSVQASDIYGDVSLEHVGGEVSMESVHGAVMGTKRAGEITLVAVDGPVEMEVSQGAGTFRSVHDDVRLTGGFGSLRIDDVDGNVSVDAQMGEVSVQGLRQGAKITMQFGEVSVGLAGPGGWNVNAIAERGEVESNLNLERRRNGSRTELTGVVGDGNHELSLEVNQGAARIIGPPAG